MEKIYVQIPSIEERNRIASFLSKIDQKSKSKKQS
ncbi:hypothetical protein D6B99_09600 [Arachidicoccus soli]|uniref:Uncharacterized protein n=1 Tax=Arachidicoccus soli TaxID=2341117 RepID=A0A386HTS7_9BACT|nr:hypothetical protein D6B99_09600 [Arachidicoccus soli]